MNKRFCVCGRDHYGNHLKWQRNINIQGFIFCSKCLGWGYLTLTGLDVFTANENNYFNDGEKIQIIKCEKCSGAAFVPISLGEFDA